MSLSKPEFVAFKSDGVWAYFLRVKTKDKFGEKVQCLKCSKVYACAGGSTKGLHDHLLHVHGIDLRASTKRPAEATEASLSESPCPTKRTTTGPMSEFLPLDMENTVTVRTLETSRIYRLLG